MHFVCFPCCFNVLIWVYGVLIIPKWLIIDLDRFQYILDGFWNFENFDICWTRSGPLNPVFVMNFLQRIQEKSGKILETYFFISENLRICEFSKFRKPQVSFFEFSKFRIPEFLIMINDEFLEIMKSRRQRIS